MERGAKHHDRHLNVISSTSAATRYSAASTLKGSKVFPWSSMVLHPLRTALLFLRVLFPWLFQTCILFFPTQSCSFPGDRWVLGCFGQLGSHQKFQVPHSQYLLVIKHGSGNPLWMGILIGTSPTKMVHFSVAMFDYQRVNKNDHLPTQPLPRNMVQLRL